MNGSRWVKVGAFLAIVLGAGWVAHSLGLHVTQISPENIRTFISSFGVWAPIVYLVAYGQPLIPLPASLMTAAGGLAFGPFWGLLAAISGSTTRACSQFAIAKLLGRDVVAKLLKGKIAQLDEKLGDNSFKTVLLVRLIPNFPFDVQNYGLGFSQARFLPYAAATLIGVMPGAFAFVYLGYSLTDPKQIWKLGLAILLILGLMFGTSAWKRRHADSVGGPS